MSSENLMFAGFALYGSILLWLVSVAIIWAIEKIWEWRSGGYPVSPWYWRIAWVHIGLGAFAWLCVINFTWQAFEFYG